MVVPTRFGRSVMSAAVLVFLLCGCANQSDADRTRTEGAAAGAVVGVVLAKVMGGSDKTAVAAGAVGAGAGYVVGDQVVKKKESYAQQEEQLRAAIQAAEQSTAQARELNAKLATDILALKRRQELLLTQTQAGTARQAALKAEQQKARALMDQTTKSIATVDRQLAEQRRVVAEQKATAPSELIAVADTRIGELDTERRALLASLEQLRLIDQRRAY